MIRVWYRANTDAYLTEDDNRPDDILLMVFGLNSNFPDGAWVPKNIFCNDKLTLVDKGYCMVMEAEDARGILEKYPEYFI